MSWLVPETDRRLTPNRWHAGLRPTAIRPIEGVVYHYTASSGLEGTVRWLRSPVSKASAHFVIGRDGELLQLAPLTDRCWHAGGAPTGVGVKFRGAGAVNNRTLGIELVNIGPLERIRGVLQTVYGSTYDSARFGLFEGPHPLPRVKYRLWQPFPEEQLRTLERLVSLLVAEFPVLEDLDRHVGHEDVDPTRKMDPGPAFPWSRVFAAVERSR